MSTTSQVLLVVAGGFAASVGVVLTGVLSWLTERRRLAADEARAARQVHDAARQRRHAAYLALLTHSRQLTSHPSVVLGGRGDHFADWMHSFWSQLAAVELVCDAAVRRCVDDVVSAVGEWSLASRGFNTQQLDDAIDAFNRARAVIDALAVAMRTDLEADRLSP